MRSGRSSSNWRTSSGRRWRSPAGYRSCGSSFVRIAWRSIIAAAYPETSVSLGRVTGAYFAGTGVNALTPARAGDAVKLVLVKHEVPGRHTRPDADADRGDDLRLIVATVILLWAFASGVLPGLDAIGDLPSIDWSWPIDHPRPFLVVATVWLTVIVLLVLIWSRRVKDFKDQVRHGFAILHEPRRYFLEVVSWQALSWVCASPACGSSSMRSTSTTARNVAIVLAVQSLSTLLPFTPGGIGTQQGFLVAFRDGRRQGVVKPSVMYVATTVVNVVAARAVAHRRTAR